MNPVTALCQAAMQSFADAALRAAPGSPLALAKEKLGIDAWAAAACAGLNKGVKKALTDPVLAQDLLSPFGGVAAQACMAEITADGIAAVLAAAEEAKAA